MIIMKSDKLLRKILLEAARNTRMVVQRDNIIPSREFRIGEFVTQLRRKFSDHRVSSAYSNIRVFLCENAIWTDILQLKHDGHKYLRHGSDVDYHNLIDVVESVKEEIESTTSPSSIHERITMMRQEISRECVSNENKTLRIGEQLDKVVDQYHIFCHNLNQ